MSEAEQCGSSPFTVVLVEDHPAVRAGVTQLLRAAGLDVIGAAGTAEEGLQMIIGRRPDIAVIDDRLPDGRGLDLCRTLTVEAPDVVTVIHSSFVAPQLRQDALRAGAVASVTKTIDGRDLLAVISRYTGRPDLHS